MLFTMLLMFVVTERQWCSLVFVVTVTPVSHVCKDVFFCVMVMAIVRLGPSAVFTVSVGR